MLCSFFVECDAIQLNSAADLYRHIRDEHPEKQLKDIVNMSFVSRDGLSDIFNLLTVE